MSLADVVDMEVNRGELEMTQADGTVGELLAAVGVPPAEERVYVALLDRPEMATGMISRSLDISREVVADAVAALAAKGLVTPVEGSPVRYRAAAPDVAIEVLVAKKQEELARARLTARTLSERARQAAMERCDLGGGLGMVETITGETAITQRLWQLYASAEREVMGFDRPSCLDDRIGLVSLRRGVTHRVVYSRAALESPGMLEFAGGYEAAGGQLRSAEVPVQLVIIDRDTAVIPTHPDGETATAVLVRSQSLIEVMAAFFDTVWAHATPLVFGANGDIPLPRADDGEVADMAHLLSLLVAGCTREAIARQVGVSVRTLDRRIQALMRSLDADTRFQAGWMAALRMGQD